MRYTLLSGLRVVLAGLIVPPMMSACSSTVPTPDIISSQSQSQTRAQSQTHAQTQAPLMSWSDLTGRDSSMPTSTHRYGDGEAQIVDLWQPDSPGPHPVVLMIHGGCWQKAIADRTLMNYAAEDLRQRGLAVWNIEYRGVDEVGGGYPGTFEDVSAATELLFERGPALGLDTDRVVAYGHSAGGHLAAWLATKHTLNDQDVLPIDAVIISGGLADLEASTPVTLPSCLANISSRLTGPRTLSRSDVFADTSPARMLPTSIPFISVNGDSDRIAPPSLGQDFTDLVKASGTPADYVEVPNTGHVELISPGTRAFNVQADLIQDYLGQ